MDSVRYQHFDSSGKRQIGRLQGSNAERAAREWHGQGIMADARKFLQLDETFDMLRGPIMSPSIAYETWGSLNGTADNGVLLFTGLSPSAHVASSPGDPTHGWWEQMVGPGKPLDTDRYFVICVNSLGSCFGSTGPASDDPLTGQRYRLDFPVLSLEDVAKAAHLVVRHLGIERLFSVVGASMGGMTALAYTILYPGQSDGLLSISSATGCLPFSIALRSVQRETIRKDPAWRDGMYDEEQPPLEGMRLARKLGMITYRSSKEWSQRFGRNRVARVSDGGGAGADPFEHDFEIESYLQDRAEQFIGGFDANCYLYLSRAMDLFHAADHGGSEKDVLARIGIKRALVIGVETDFLFPPQQQKNLADGLASVGTDVELQMLDSIQGHDSFLIDKDRFGPALAGFF